MLLTQFHIIKKTPKNPKPDKLYSFSLQLISLKALSDLRINCHGNKKCFKKVKPEEKIEAREYEAV